MLAEGTVKVSFTLDEWLALKRGILRDRSYAHRVSLGLATRLLEVQDEYGEYDCVLRELDYLEDIRSHSNTKQPKQFRKAPLHPFWHKHFAATKHMLPNIGIHWGVAFGNNGNRRLNCMIGEIAKTDGDNPDIWPGKLAHQFVIDAWKTRASSHALTGDWIVYAKYNGFNYYLDLATHAEARRRGDAAIFEKVRHSSRAEFPFLF